MLQGVKTRLTPTTKKIYDWHYLTPRQKKNWKRYHSVTAADELEWMRRKTAHDEAQALYNARREEHEKWQDVAAENERLRALLAKYQSEGSHD